MKAISKLMIACLVPALLLVPSVDAIFSATMPGKALAESALLLSWGWGVSRCCSRCWMAPYGSAVVGAATLLFLFWMIPRSIDLTQISPVANALYVISLFAVGCLLSQYLPLLPRVASAIYALYFPSMLVAFGLLYASQSTLWCSAYTLEDQHAFGWMLVSLGGAAYVLVLGSATKWLIRPSVNR